MNANRIDNQFNMSFSSESTSQHLDTNPHKDPTQEQPAPATTQESVAITQKDSFESSSNLQTANPTYQAPSKLQAAVQSFSQQIKLQYNNFTPQGTKQLEENSNQKLTDFFGKDSQELKDHQNTLTKLKDLDPKLAQEAMFLVTLMGKDEADKFLTDMAKFAKQTNNTTSAMSNLNVVATAGTTDKADPNAEIIANAKAVVDQASSKVSERYSAKISSAISTYSKENLSFHDGNLSIKNENFSLELSEKINININFSSLSFVNFGSSTSTGSMTDPLVFDLAGDGIDLTTREDGVEFDIDGDGEKEQTSFIQGDDALLYLDQTGNGIADDGKELFGDQEGDANGYAKLAKHDENNDGKIDHLDSVYKDLRLWQDKDGDGYNQLSESMTLLEAGIKSIQLKYDEINEGDGKGNITAQAGSFTKMDNSTGYTADMLFNTRAKNYNTAKSFLA